VVEGEAAYDPAWGEDVRSTTPPWSRYPLPHAPTGPHDDPSQRTPPSPKSTLREWFDSVCPYLSMNDEGTRWINAVEVDDKVPFVGSV
jgi:hypothetical protein